MRVGLTLHGSLLSDEGARFARQLGVEDVVIHLTDYGRNADPAAYLAGGTGPINGDCIDAPLWSYEHMADIVAMLARHGLKMAAMENISPNFWSDILLDGPDRAAQMEGLKRLVRDAGRAGIPVIGYNFSLAGVWGWQRKRLARGGAMTAVFDLDAIDGQSPIPDGMLGNMRYRPTRSGAAPVTVDDAALWDRLARFLAELVPVAEEAGVRLAAHPDDPPVDRLRGTARLVNSHAKYDRLLALAPSPANALEFCIGSLAEMAERRHLRDDPRTSLAGAPSPMSTSATCAARCPAMSRPSWTTATSTWRRSSASSPRRASTACWCPTTCRSSTAPRPGTPATPIRSAT